MAAAVITRDGSLGIRFEGGWGIGNPWIRLAQPGKRPIFLFRPPPPSLFRALLSLELSSRTHVFLFSFVVWFHLLRLSRIWAKKPYVDQKRIGIWGWVRLNFVFFTIYHASIRGADPDYFAGSMPRALYPVFRWLR